MDVLVQRLVANPHDQEALAYAHQAGASSPQAYAELLERVGQNTQDPTFAGHWLSEAANVWAVALNDAHRAAQLLMAAVERDPTSQVAGGSAGGPLPRAGRGQEPRRPPGAAREGPRTLRPPEPGGRRLRVLALRRAGEPLVPGAPLPAPQGHRELPEGHRPRPHQHLRDLRRPRALQAGPAVRRRDPALRHGAGPRQRAGAQGRPLPRRGPRPRRGRGPRQRDAGAPQRAHVRPGRSRRSSRRSVRHGPGAQAGQRAAAPGRARGGRAVVRCPRRGVQRASTGWSYTTSPPSTSTRATTARFSWRCTTRSRPVARAASRPKPPPISRPTPRAPWRQTRAPWCPAPCSRTASPDADADADDARRPNRAPAPGPRRPAARHARDLEPSTSPTPPAWFARSPRRTRPRPSTRKSLGKYKEDRRADLQGGFSRVGQGPPAQVRGATPTC